MHWRLSPASRRLESRLMASINRSLKAGRSDGVECRRALPAQRGRKGEALTSGPHGAARENMTEVGAFQYITSCTLVGSMAIPSFDRI
jgi:hypothetical protein